MYGVTLDREIQAFIRLADRPVECVSSQEVREEIAKHGIREETLDARTANGEEATKTRSEHPITNL